MRQPDRETVEALFKRGLTEGGSRKSLARLEWVVAGNCLRPVSRNVDARPAAESNERYIMVSRETAVPLQIDLDVRCRRCQNCLRYRKALWAAKAVTEYRLAVRTWSGTFTLRPDEHEMVRHLCVAEAAKVNQDFDVLSPDERFSRRHGKISKWLTLWLKRVRKNSGARIRYMMVCEAHVSGLPHYHALIHETCLNLPVSKRILQGAWPHGFTNFKLLPADESWRATYACKYLSKDILARVRASIAYGNTLRVKGMQ